MLSARSPRQGCPRPRGVTASTAQGRQSPRPAPPPAGAAWTYQLAGAAKGRYGREEWPLLRCRRRSAREPASAPRRASRSAVVGADEVQQLDLRAPGRERRAGRERGRCGDEQQRAADRRPKQGLYRPCPVAQPAERPDGNRQDGFRTRPPPAAFRALPYRSKRWGRGRHRSDAAPAAPPAVPVSRATSSSSLRVFSDGLSRCTERMPEDWHSTARIVSILAADASAGTWIVRRSASRFSEASSVSSIRMRP